VDEHGERFFVSGSDPTADLDGIPGGIKAFYKTERDYERQEAATQVVAMLDDIADAIWTLSDEKMPPEEKKRARALVRELQEIVKTLPRGVAGWLAGEIASRFGG
jgi:hypothetical protein